MAATVNGFVKSPDTALRCIRTYYEAINNEIRIIIGYNIFGLYKIELDGNEKNLSLSNNHKIKRIDILNKDIKHACRKNTVNTIFVKVKICDDRFTIGCEDGYEYRYCPRDL